MSNYHDWKFSSYNSILSDKETLVCREQVIDWFGDKEAFIKFHLENIQYNKIKDLILSDDF